MTAASPALPIVATGEEDAACPAARGGRPRSRAVDEALCRATLQALEDEGYARLSMAGVARRAGVSGTTLYRRWSSKEDLVVAALAALRTAVSCPDTGSLEGDLVAMLHEGAGALRNERGRILRGLIGEIFTNADLSALVRDRLGGPARQQVIEMLERAVRRGEIPASDPGVALDVIQGPLLHRFMIRGESPTPEVVDHLAPMIAAALKAGQAAGSLRP
jgi:AcrR family transcriptional regulator